jgi:hypothetical protein
MYAASDCEHTRGASACMATFVTVTMYAHVLLRHTYSPPREYAHTHVRTHAWPCARLWTMYVRAYKKWSSQCFARAIEYPAFYPIGNKAGCVCVCARACACVWSCAGTCTLAAYPLDCIPAAPALVIATCATMYLYESREGGRERRGKRERERHSHAVALGIPRGAASHCFHSAWL